MQLIGKFGHSLPVLCPYLEFSISLPWQLKASFKYIMIKQEILNGENID
jgi:hypothetical protein